MQSLNELFENTVKDLYNAEKQLVKALPKMAKQAQHPQLKQALTTHLEETNEQVRRLEQVAKMCGFKPTGVVCKGMQGLVEEANEHLGEVKAGPVSDALIIECAQKNEHYEIGSYGTLIEWAKVLGKDDCIDLLKQNLAEEEKTDQLLSEMAEREVNRMAAEAPMAAPAKKTTSRSKAGMQGKVSVR